MMEEQKNVKKPISHERIYGIMICVPLGASFAFFLKNLIGGSMHGVLIIGICMLLLAGICYYMKIRKFSSYIKEFVLSVAILLLVFAISLNSGASYSDDFSLYLACIGLGGMYMEPKITRVQIVVADVLFALMYAIHPEKAESLGQYILCMACFTLAGVLFALAIKRGRAFIEIGEERAKEAEHLVGLMKRMGVELDKDFMDSSVQIENSTNGLKKGSASITQGTRDVTDNCGEVYNKIIETEEQLQRLNEEVGTFEQVMTENRENVQVMSGQVQEVSGTISEAHVVFREMETQMHQVVKMARQMGDISFDTTILALNASIEAARAGDAGAGFAVVAERMRTLSETSNQFSEQVSEVIKDMLEQVEKTAEQFEESDTALQQSEQTMETLQGSFERLQNQFADLYANMEKQNDNVRQVEFIFDRLQGNISEMQGYSVENQKAVESIVDAMNIYKESISQVIESTQKL